VKVANDARELQRRKEAQEIRRTLLKTGLTSIVFSDDGISVDCFSRCAHDVEIRVVARFVCEHTETEELRHGFD